MNKNSESDSRSRLPPGQHLTKKFPVLQKGRIQHIDRDEYKLEVVGQVKKPQTFTLEELRELKNREVICDIHCVTGWSKFDAKWEGISFKKLFEIVQPKETANFLEFNCADGGFTTTVALEKVISEKNILALRYDGVALGDKHGGPVRAVIPDLYFYKSAKWITKINFLKEDNLGYWERGGYSNKADPWKEQRYRRND